MYPFQAKCKIIAHNGLWLITKTGDLKTSATTFAVSYIVGETFVHSNFFIVHI